MAGPPLTGATEPAFTRPRRAVSLVAELFRLAQPPKTSAALIAAQRRIALFIFLLIRCFSSGPNARFPLTFLSMKQGKKQAVIPPSPANRAETEKGGNAGKKLGHFCI